MQSVRVQLGHCRLSPPERTQTGNTAVTSREVIFFFLLATTEIRNGWSGGRNQTFHKDLKTWSADINARVANPDVTDQS